jgi:copper chaperone CopZ
MNRTTLKIDGMSCGHCVMSVKKTLQHIAGVEVEQVAIGSATVSYDPASTTPATIAQAVTDSGYTAAAV